MALKNHAIEEPDFLVGTLNDLAAKATSPEQSAILRALSHLAKISTDSVNRLTKVEADLAALQRRDSDISELQNINDRQDKEIAELRAQISKKEAMFEGGLWVTLKVSAIVAFATTTSFTLYKIIHG